MSSKNLALRRAALAVVLALSGCTYTAPDSTPSPIAPAAMDSLDFQAKLFMDQGVVSAVVQVRWPGGEWSKAYGVRDLDTKAPAQPTDLVEVASITKTMTAVTVLKLVDDGLIGLDDPVNDIIPGFKTLLHPPGPITARQLLGHTSGVPEFTDVFYKDVDVRTALGHLLLTPETALRLAGTRPWEPISVGSFSYSNTGYMALGLLVETLRHKPFPQVLREEVIDPLGLKDTTTERLNLHEPRLLHGYIALRGERLDVTDNSDTAGSPHAGVTSTVADVNTFYAALFQGRLLSAKSLAEMKKRPSLAPYALGVWAASGGCLGGTRFEGRGAFWAYVTVAVSSEDGKYVASMTVVPPVIPSDVEDPSTQSKRDLYQVQMESTLNETLDRLCQH